MESIISLWNQIEHWLNTHYPQMWATTRSSLAPGASEEAVHRAEATLGVTLPEDFKAFYRLHNGEGAGFLLDIHEWLSLDTIIGTWQMYMDFLRDGIGTYADHVDDVWGPIQPVFWHPKWLPFVEDGAGGGYCLDLSPAPGGKIGQVIEWSCDDGPGRIAYPSFEAMFSLFLEDLKAGVYVEENFWGKRQPKPLTEEASPITKMLAQAMQFIAVRHPDDQVATYTSVLRMKEATPEEQTQAYLYLIAHYFSHRDWERANYYYQRYTAAGIHTAVQYRWHSDLRQLGLLFSSYSNWSSQPEGCIL